MHHSPGHDEGRYLHTMQIFPNHKLQNKIHIKFKINSFEFLDLHKDHGNDHSTIRITFDNDEVLECLFDYFDVEESFP